MVAQIVRQQDVEVPGETDEECQCDEHKQPEVELLRPDLQGVCIGPVFWPLADCEEDAGVAEDVHDDRYDVHNHVGADAKESFHCLTGPQADLVTLKYERNTVK